MRRIEVKPGQLWAWPEQGMLVMIVERVEKPYGSDGGNGWLCVDIGKRTTKQCMNIYWSIGVARAWKLIC